MTKNAGEWAFAVIDEVKKLIETNEMSWEEALEAVLVVEYSWIHRASIDTEEKTRQKETFLLQKKDEFDTD